MGVRKWLRRSDAPAALDAGNTQGPKVETAPLPAPPDPEPALRVVVVDDDPDARDFIRFGLEIDGFDVVGEGDQGPSALRAVAEGKPDLVLLDLHMPDIGGLELLPELREAHRPAKFVVISAIDATYMTESAMKAGAIGFIKKGVSPRSVNLHLRKVARAGAVKVVRPYPLTPSIPDGPRLGAMASRQPAS